MKKTIFLALTALLPLAHIESFWTPSINLRSVLMAGTLAGALHMARTHLNTQEIAPQGQFSSVEIYHPGVIEKGVNPDTVEIANGICISTWYALMVETAKTPSFYEKAMTFIGENRYAVGGAAAAVALAAVGAYAVYKYMKKPAEPAQ